MTRDLFIASDPGFKGGVAVIDPVNQLVLAAMRMPVIGGKGRDRRIDCAGVSFFVDWWAARIAVGAVEAVHARPGQDVESMVRFGQGQGEVRGVIIGKTGAPMLEPEPAAWKGALRVTDDKATSIKLALELFPNAREWVRCGADDGVAEAILIAWHAWLRVRELA